MTVLCAGFSCVDLIKEPFSNNKVSIGGTAANVASFLSFINQKPVSIIIPKLRNNFLKKEFSKRGVNVIEIGNETSNCPIIIESIESYKHTFTGICPFCNYKIREIKLPNLSDFEIINKKIDFPVLFFYDRISPGIKAIINKNTQGWNFYEPNSLRGYKNFIENAKQSDIIKFSNDRISEFQTKNILKDLQKSKVKLAIITLGDNGLKYAIRGANGLSDWIKINSIKNENTVDSSGAGDWMSSVLIYRLLEHYPQKPSLIDDKIINSSLIQAKRIASKSCEYLGAHGICENEDGVNQINNVLQIATCTQNVFYEHSLHCPNCKKKL